MAQSPGLQRSTKGASKQRRDLINGEIERLKDLLPLSETIRQRLFQLQVMSLVCIYIRKERYLPHVLSHQYYPCMFLADEDFDICKTLRGFLLMVTRQGKLLYISENAADFLGHSVEEIMSQGDSLYDLVDPRDHGTVQAELLSGPPSVSINMTFPDERIFMCRMNLNRAARRHLQYHKFIIVQGRYLHPAEYYQTLQTFTGPGGPIHPVFAAFCTPLITPENAENLSSGNTTVFSSLHNMDMKFLQLDDIGIYHLGYTSDDLTGTSWYRLIHPNDLPEASFKHKLLCEDKETCCVLLIRLQTLSGHYLWLHTVLALKEGVRNESVEQLIMATYQKLSDIEAATLQANCWIYSAPHRIQEQQFGVLSARASDMSYLTPGAGAALSTTPLAPEPALSPSPVPPKPKRKYSKPKVAKAVSSGSNSNGEDYPRLSTDITAAASTGRRATAGHLGDMSLANLHGLSPPVSDSPLADADQITVEIPCSHHLPPYFNLPSMLTPETSPANSTGSSCSSGVNVRHGQATNVNHAVPPCRSTVYTAKCVNTPSTPNNRPNGNPVTRIHLAKSPLPVIEPHALEAYLSHVEQEGCLPVFRGGPNDSIQLFSTGSLVNDAAAGQTLRQLLDAPLAGSSSGCTSTSRHPADSSDMAFSMSHWHRSLSWSPSSPYEDLAGVACENPFAAVLGDVSQYRPPPQQYAHVQPPPPAPPLNRAPLHNQPASKSITNNSNNNARIQTSCRHGSLSK